PDASSAKETVSSAVRTAGRSAYCAASASRRAPSEWGGGEVTASSRDDLRLQHHLAVERVRDEAVLLGELEDAVESSAIGRSGNGDAGPNDNPGDGGSSSLDFAQCRGRVRSITGKSHSRVLGYCHERQHHAGIY